MAHVMSYGDNAMALKEEGTRAEAGTIPAETSGASNAEVNNKAHLNGSGFQTEKDTKPGVGTGNMNDEEDRDVPAPKDDDEGFRAERETKPAVESGNINGGDDNILHDPENFDGISFRAEREIEPVMEAVNTNGGAVVIDPAPEDDEKGLQTERKIEPAMEPGNMNRGEDDIAPALDVDENFEEFRAEGEPKPYIGPDGSIIAGQDDISPSPEDDDPGFRPRKTSETMANDEESDIVSSHEDEDLAVPDSDGYESEPDEELLDSEIQYFLNQLMPPQNTDSDCGSAPDTVSAYDSSPSSTKRSNCFSCFTGCFRRKP